MRFAMAFLGLGSLCALAGCGASGNEENAAASPERPRWIGVVDYYASTVPASPGTGTWSKAAWTDSSTGEVHPERHFKFIGDTWTMSPEQRCIVRVFGSIDQGWASPGPSLPQPGQDVMANCPPDFAIYASSYFNYSSGSRNRATRPQSTYTDTEQADRWACKAFWGSDNERVCGSPEESRRRWERQQDERREEYNTAEQRANLNRVKRDEALENLRLISADYYVRPPGI